MNDCLLSLTCHCLSPGENSRPLRVQSKPRGWLKISQPWQAGGPWDNLHRGSPAQWRPHARTCSRDGQLACGAEPTLYRRRVCGYECLVCLSPYLAADGGAERGGATVCLHRRAAWVGIPSRTRSICLTQCTSCTHVTSAQYTRCSLALCVCCSWVLGPAGRLKPLAPCKSAVPSSPGAASSITTASQMAGGALGAGDILATSVALTAPLPPYLPTHLPTPPSPDRTPEKARIHSCQEVALHPSFLNAVPAPRKDGGTPPHTPPHPTHHTPHRSPTHCLIHSSLRAPN